MNSLSSQCSPRKIGGEVLANRPSTDPAVISRLLENRARAWPHGLAISFRQNSLTYGELDRRAKLLASHLQRRGARRESLVAICLERSPEFIVAALAIHKCGAAYMPLDPAQPIARMRSTLQDAGVSGIITSASSAAWFRDLTLNIVALDEEEPQIAARFNGFVEAHPDPDDLAYVIYTSGSTGRPKGVEITHRSLSNLIEWHVRAFDVSSATRASFQAGVGFDAAVWEIWPALAAGASLHLPDEETRLSAVALRDWLVAREITISFVPTNLAEQLIDIPWPSTAALRFLLTGADTLQRFPPAGLPFALINNYGPTEATVVATSGLISAENKGCGLPTIGNSITGVDVHIFDEQRHEVAVGRTGEIYLGGAGVARGYRNQPALTADKFVANPHGTGLDRLYRTGDLARRSANGGITFLGRLDDQVKIRGYRIELNEISTVLSQHPAVHSSIVLARDVPAGGKQLIAYVVAAKDCVADEQNLRAACRELLPDYMEPAAFVWLESFPLTLNGKIDRAALPAPGLGDSGRSELFVAARNPGEEQVAAIIADVLNLPRVSVHDDFFNLGAHSLLGAQIIARIRARFGAELKLLDVFDAPTIAQLTAKIEDLLTSKLSAMSDAEVEAALVKLSA